MIWSNAEVIMYIVSIYSSEARWLCGRKPCKCAFLSESALFLAQSFPLNFSKGNSTETLPTNLETTSDSALTSVSPGTRLNFLGALQTLEVRAGVRILLKHFFHQDGTRIAAELSQLRGGSRRICRQMQTLGQCQLRSGGRSGACNLLSPCRAIAQKGPKQQTSRQGVEMALQQAMIE